MARSATLERVSEVVRRLEQDVVGADDLRANRLVVALARDVQDRRTARPIGLRRELVQRLGAREAAEEREHRTVRGKTEARTRRLAIAPRCGARHRTPHDAVLRRPPDPESDRRERPCAQTEPRAGWRARDARRPRSAQPESRAAERRAPSARRRSRRRRARHPDAAWRGCGSTRTAHAPHGRASARVPTPGRRGNPEIENVSSS